MSRENVEVVRRGYAALGSGDLNATFALFDPEVEIETATDAPSVDFEKLYRGPEGFLKFLEQLSQAWDEFHWEPEEYIDAGDDVVVVFIRMTARGRGSGIEVEQPMAHVCTIGDGKLVRLVTFWERAAALEAVGLRE